MMDKSSLLQLLAEKTNVTTGVAGIFLDALAEVVNDSLRDNMSVALPGLGQFHPELSEASVEQNSDAVSIVGIAQRINVQFKSAMTLNTQINLANSNKLPNNNLSANVLPTDSCNIA